ncbi:MAG: hypothetical protein HY744_33695 [Deltaproteobacteria bacterium]|nr:hypothetical protein [Deltaproteobacteria bacterium]
MSAQPIDHTVRQLLRADEIAKKALDAAEGELVGLKGLAPEMRAAAAAFASANELVRSMERALAKETAEGESAVRSLAVVYDELLALATRKAGFSGGAADSFATHDDFIAVAESMEQAFEAAGGEQWAKAALGKLAPAVDATAKEYTEQVAAGRALQKAQAQRARAADEAREILVPFRKAVRASFGRSSKEYRDLRDRRYAGGSAEPPPAPPA